MTESGEPYLLESPDPAARALARRLMWVGVAFFWVVFFLLGFGLGVPTIDAILLAVLLAAVPAFSIAQLPLVDGAPIDRLPAYWGSILTLWLIGSACWFVGTRTGGASAVGLVPLSPPILLAWSLGLTAAGLAVIGLFRPLGALLGFEERPVLRQLLPRTTTERQVFVLLSFAAGVGEELAYRGYAIPMLAPWLGVTGSVVVTSAVFGVLHGYQGSLGIVRTSLMGGILAVGFLASGSLWPCMVAHVLIDVVAGVVLGDRLLGDGPPVSEPAPGGDDASPPSR